MAKSADPDLLLKTALDHLGSHWFEPRVGLVAASLMTTSGEIFSATSYMAKPGLFLHAESALLNLLDKKPGGRGVAANGLMAVTLSPCIGPSETREGISCSELLMDMDIRHVHAGAIDKKVGGPEAYAPFRFKFSLTKDGPLSNSCKALLEVFGEFGPLVNTDIFRIKEELGTEFYSEVFGDRR